MTDQFDFDVESDSEGDIGGDYNRQTVIIGGGGKVVYKSTEQKTKVSRKPIEPVSDSISDNNETIHRIHPVVLPSARSEQCPLQEEEKINYVFTKVPWQTIVKPISSPTPLVQKVDAVVHSDNQNSDNQNYGYSAVTHKQQPYQPRYQQPTRKPLQPGDKKNTRLCQFVKFQIKEGDVFVAENKCKNSACNFAHSIQEYKPSLCIYKGTCKNGNECRFCHDDIETKNQYYIRTLSFQNTPQDFRPKPFRRD